MNQIDVVVEAVQRLRENDNAGEERYGIIRKDSQFQAQQSYTILSQRLIATRERLRGSIVNANS